MRSSLLSLTALFAIILTFMLTGCAQQEPVTLESLLNEMTNREAVARYPDPYYTTRQFSSYDRDSEKAGTTAWFANWDRSMFLRTDTVDGRSEYVMMDDEGPGAIVRFWMTFAGPGAGQGTLRIYVDHQDTPVIEGKAMDVISGGQVVGAPLSTSVSPKTDYKIRGHDLYLPIPYSEHVKVTYESENVNKPGATEGGEAVYYQINYRDYEPGTPVETFSQKRLEEAASTLQKVQQQLDDRDKHGYVNSLNTEQVSFDQSLGAGESISKTLEGASAIRRLALKVTAANVEQALRSTILEIEFDGKRTVWAPVGDFFATGYQYRANDNWYTRVSADSVMSAWWIMPFEEEARISVHNLGDQPVSLSHTDITWSPWSWDDRSMHFGATWQVRNDLYTGERKGMDGSGGAFDINYTQLDGRGVYMGDAIALYNTSYAWWGEGDEKIYIDGEAFPSHFGTGTEDYYGYAWVRPEVFTDHPFISQPDGSGNITPGYTVNLRYRTLDAIPFRDELKVDMEMWHWVSTTIDHAVTSYFYLRPGGSTSVEPHTEGARDPVALNRSDIFSPQITDGNVEGENLVLDEVTGGGIKYQWLEEPGWSGNKQLWWRGAQPGDRLTMHFTSSQSGTFDITGNFTLAPDYGKVRMSINGRTALATFDGYSDSLNTVVKKLGRFSLEEGSNTLQVEILGVSPTEDRAFWGLDYLEFERTGN